MNIKKWVKYNQRLRNNLIKKESGVNKYLLANFSGTAQQKDIEKRTDLVGGDYYRIKIDTKALSDSKKERGEFKPVDFSDLYSINNALKDDNAFDMPYWAFQTLSQKPTIQDCSRTFISQLKGCNLNCPWCYVDDISKNSKQGNGADFFSMQQIRNSFLQEIKNQAVYKLRPSGGEPTLAIEQWIETLRGLEQEGLEKKIYVYGDTNQTTGSFIQYLEKTNQIEKNLLEKVGEYNNFGLLCSFKGTDTVSFLQAIGLTKKDNSPNPAFTFLEQERWKSFNMFVKAGIDAYPFIYDPDPKTIKNFMEQGIKKHGDGFALKTWIFPLKLYTPAKQRLEKKGVNPEKFQERLDEKFEQSKRELNDFLEEKFKIPYKTFQRAGIKLNPQE